MSDLRIALPAQTAGGAAITTTLGSIGNEDDTAAQVSAVTLTPPSGFTTVTGVATNNVTFAVRQVRAGAVIATVASVTLNAGTNLVAETVLNVPLTAAGQLPQIQAHDVFDVVMTQNGTGLAVGAGVLAQVEVN